MASPYFDSSNQQIDESKAGLLKAVAEGGTAGKAAFDAAAAQAAQAKQDAVSRAAQRSALYGVGGNDQTFLGAYDARMNQGNVNRTNFESGLAQTQASGESYLEKARSAIPILQGINTNKITDQEGKIKLAIQAAKDKAAAAAAEDARKEQLAIDRENRAAGRAIDRENRTNARTDAKDAANGPNISIQGLLGLADQVSKQPAAPLRHGTTTEDRNQIATDEINRQLAGQGDVGRQVDLAAQIGRTIGVPETKLAELYGPAVQKTAVPPKEDIAKALATKYDTKGVTYDLAKSALNGQDFKTFVNWLSGGADGSTQDEAADKIRRFFINGEGRTGGNSGPWNAEYQILMGEYVPLLPKA